MGLPPGFEPVTSRTPNSSSPIARHACDAARPVSVPREADTGDDEVGLSVTD